MSKRMTVAQFEALPPSEQAKLTKQEARYCFSCRASQVEDDPEGFHGWDVDQLSNRFYQLTCPGSPPLRGYLCEEHLDSYADDGYQWKELSR